MIPMALSMLFIPYLSLSFCTVLPPRSPIKALKFPHFSLPNFCILLLPSLECTPTITCALTPFNSLISVIAAGYKLSPEDGRLHTLDGRKHVPHTHVGLRCITQHAFCFHHFTNRCYFSSHVNRVPSICLKISFQCIRR